MLRQRQQVPRELQWLSGRRKGCTLLLDALALHSSPLNMTKTWSPLAPFAWPSTHPSHLHAYAFAPPLGQALQLKHCMNMCYSVVQQKLLSSTWTQQCHHCHSGSASHPIPSLGVPGASMPLLMAPSRTGGGQNPRGNTFPQERRGWWFEGGVLHTLEFLPAFFHHPTQ